MEYLNRKKYCINDRNQTDRRKNNPCRSSDIRTDPALFEEDMHEMQLLCETAGASVVAIITQKRERPESSTYLGRGKIEEIRAVMKANDAKTLIIDAQLSPAQVRNIEKIVQGKVIDRSQLILDIFAKHARTSESRIQVELAQMRTLLPKIDSCLDPFLTAGRRNRYSWAW